MTIIISKPVNLSQLQQEMVTAGVPINQGLILEGTTLQDVQGGPATDFRDEAAAQAVVDAHQALRDKTDAELTTEFQASDDPARKQDLRDMISNLLPREQVPM